jgi:hypothetical protein
LAKKESFSCLSDKNEINLSSKNLQRDFAKKNWFDTILASALRYLHLLSELLSNKLERFSMPDESNIEQGHSLFKESPHVVRLQV